jgi:arginine-tRNA-protein transferase
MKLFLSEYRHDYLTYTFGYTVYAVFEKTQDLNEMYSNGFLPYTGNINLIHSLYYKSRGIRVDLNRFKDTSENRRVNRKVTPLALTAEITSVSAFKEKEAFFEFARKYREERIGEDKMPDGRIEYILTRPYLSHVLTFRKNEKAVAYVLAVITDKCFHFWLSFYETGYLDQNIPLGKWLMWKCIHLAREMGLEHLYLGNGYLEKSLYKSRDFTAVEFYDGNEWSKDLKTLQALCAGDNQLTDLDQFKLNTNPNEWLQSWLETHP